MRQVRVYSGEPLAAHSEQRLSRGATEHVLRVLRMRAGEALTLFDGRGGEYPAQLLRTEKASAVVAVGEHHAIERESPLSITLLQSLARGEKMDWIVQKATELGVAAIVPVASERSEVRLDGERAGRRLAHWRGVAIAACEQSGRARLPEVAAPCALAQALQALPASGCRLALDPEAEATVATLQPAARLPVVVGIGPEGGWSPGDLARLRGAGFTGLRLGPRVLRTETAGIAAIAALQARLGDFV